MIVSVVVISVIDVVGAVLTAVVVGVVVPDVVVSVVVSCGGIGGDCGGIGSGGSGAAMVAAAKLYRSSFDCLLFMSFMKKLFSHHMCFVIERTCIFASASDNSSTSIG